MAWLLTWILQRRLKNSVKLRLHKPYQHTWLHNWNWKIHEWRQWMCLQQKMGGVKPTSIPACPTKPYWLCRPFSGAVWNNAYSFFSAQYSSHLTSIPCQYSSWHPVVQLLMIPPKISVFLCICFCITSDPAAPSALLAQTLAKRECLPSIEKNWARDVKIREFLVLLLRE